MGVKITGPGVPATVRIRIVGFVEQVSAVLPGVFGGIAPKRELPGVGGFIVPLPAVFIEPPLFADAGEGSPAAGAPPEVLGRVCADDVLREAVLPLRRGPVPDAMGCEEVPWSRPVGWTASLAWFRTSASTTCFCLCKAEDTKASTSPARGFWSSGVWLGDAKFGPTEIFASFLDEFWGAAGRGCWELFSGCAEGFLAAASRCPDTGPAARTE